LRKVHDALRRVAPRPLSILITGETGTGKELLAREIHRLSERRGPLVAINTATLPETLIESELFGYERGAFTGAQASRAGLIETADQGTLFLDEIGELPLALQSKLLRVLEERSVRRVGATAERPVDLRVIAATHQDLHALVADKRFRQDLLFRIEGAEVHVPSLRERAAEIAELAHALVAEIEPGRPPAIDPAALRVLEHHAWPGNVRELKHVLERALAFAGGEPIALEHLPPSLGKAAPQAPSKPPAAADVRASVRDFERERITEALQKAGGNRTKAAQILGLPRRTLVYKLSKMRIPEE
jgi:transcriptional regulator with PAS, ATPase and Fis domain